MKTIKFDYEQYRGKNVFLVLSAFKRTARRAGIADRHISKVLDDCQTGDYDNVFKVIGKVCE